jgi:hypothetical protein
MPEWALFLTFAIGVTALAVGGWWMVERTFPQWRTEPSSGVVVGIAQTVMTLFALVLAFAVVSLDGSYTNASDNVRSEANSLTQIIGDLSVFPAAARKRVAEAAGAYVQEVRQREFPALRVGKTDAQSNVLLDRLFATVQALAPTTDAQRGFYSAAVSSLSELVSQRRDRLAAADSALPVAFWTLILLTAVTSLAITSLIKTHSRGLEIVLVSAIAIVIGVGLLTTLLLEYPFSGSIAVSSSPFGEGALAHLPGVRP